MSSVDQERRRFWRASFHSGAKLLIDSEEYDVEIEDLSLRGALVKLPERVNMHTNARCRLQLNLAPGTDILLWGHIAHVDDRQVGMKCENIDLDSVTHLRRLIELNVGDPVLLEEEISFLVQPEKIP
ncbi:MAG TPA: PilZ domain-containing protein [Rhodocyclaceae bacterium]|nr:PilZ domain-containing protein [Rhodocyclaceae bacterium]